MGSYLEKSRSSQRGLILLELRLLEKEALPAARFELERVMAKVTVGGNGISCVPGGGGNYESAFSRRMDELMKCREKVVALEEKREQLKRLVREVA